MFNIYQSQPAEIIKVKKETPKVKHFKLKFLDKKLQKKFYCLPGQFVEVGLPGFGEAPFAPSSAFQDKDYFELCIRAVGLLTNKLSQLKNKDQILVRGPYGHGFPEIKEAETLLVAGGLGIIPLRSLILTQIKKNLGSKLTVFYGARAAEDFLFADEFKEWQKLGVKLYLTIDKECPGWEGCRGAVTILFDQVFKTSNLSALTSSQFAILCGPPLMYKFVLEKLLQYGFKDENIYLSLERRIHCGVGVCQHCAIGSKYVCKDGPVFKYKEIKDVSGAL